MGENDIVITFDKDEVKPKEDLNGTIKINYRGRYDSVVLNSQIQNSSDIFTFIKLNEKKINHSFARMSILKQEIKNVNEINFTAITEHVPEKLSNVKFRASIIQEHKEVADVVAFLRITP